MRSKTRFRIDPIKGRPQRVTLEWGAVISLGMAARQYGCTTNLIFPGERVCCRADEE